MENPSEPEKSFPEHIQPTYVRPPGLECAMGIAIFGLLLAFFSVIQGVIFYAQVHALSPELNTLPFSMEMLNDPQFRVRSQQLQTHGDVIAPTALWSGLIGLVLILASVFLWKRGNAPLFLGMLRTRPRQYLKWIGIFLLLGLGTELITRNIPGFETDFLPNVLATSTNKIMLLIGVGVLAPLFEEFLLRGLLFGSLRHIADEHVTVAITASVFTLMHMQYQWTILLLILPMGVVLGYARARSGSIWVPVVIHILHNSAGILIPI